MPSTHLSLHYHVIFSTKDRRPVIRTDWRGRLHAFLGGTVTSCGGIPEKIGGIDDHVHMLIALRATHRLSDVMRQVKSCSSSWVHTTIGKRVFAWQEGYGAFTVSPSRLARVREYIERQQEHHQKMSFKQEYGKFLQKSGAEFEEKYLW